MSENHKRPLRHLGPSPNARPWTTTSGFATIGTVPLGSMTDNVVMGVDIGGTGIKGAPVDLDKGELAGERFRILTPKPATPKAEADVVGEVVEHFNWKGPVGATFPAVVKDGVTLSAANVDKDWIGANAAEIFTQR